MELDDLKTVLLEKMQQPVATTTRVGMQKMIRKKSGSVLMTLKRNLVMELLVALLFSIFPLMIVIYFQGLYISLFSVLVLVLIPDFCIRIFRLLKAIRRYEQASLAIRQHLELLIRIIEDFCRLYLRSTMIMLPVMFTAALLFIYLDNNNKDPLLYFVDYKRASMIYSAAFAGWVILMYFFTKWYLKKVYGKLLHKLRGQLQELVEAGQ